MGSVGLACRLVGGGPWRAGSGRKDRFSPPPHWLHGPGGAEGVARIPKYNRQYPDATAETLQQRTGQLVSTTSLTSTSQRVAMGFCITCTYMKW